MFVYTIGAMISEDGVPYKIESIKIGITNMPDPRNRIKVLQIGNHRTLKLLFAIKVKDREEARKVEKNYHRRLMVAHENGEWFTMNNKRCVDLVFDELPDHKGLVFNWIKDEQL